MMMLETAVHARRDRSRELPPAGPPLPGPRPPPGPPPPDCDRRPGLRAAADRGRRAGVLGFVGLGPPRPSAVLAIGIAPPGRGAMLNVNAHWSYRVAPR